MCKLRKNMKSKFIFSFAVSGDRPSCLLSIARRDLHPIYSPPTLRQRQHLLLLSIYQPSIKRSSTFRFWPFTVVSLVAAVVYHAPPFHLSYSAFVDWPQSQLRQVQFVWLGPCVGCSRMSAAATGRMCLGGIRDQTCAWLAPRPRPVQR